MIGRFVKTPAETLDYSINWTAWLAGDTIASSSWTATSGLTIASSPAPSNTAKISTVWISGGAAGTAYEITNTITTATQRVAERTIEIRAVTSR